MYLRCKPSIFSSVPSKGISTLTKERLAGDKNVMHSLLFQLMTQWLAAAVEIGEEAQNSVS